MKRAEQPNAARTAPKRRPSARTAVPTLALKYPSSGDWTEIAGELKLGVEQADALKIAVKRTIEDIQSYYDLKSRRPGRADLVARVKRLEKALGRLAYECDRSAEVLEFVLPFDLSQYLGQSLTFSAMSEAVGRDVFPRNFDVQTRSRRTENEPGSLASLEQRTRPLRQAVGLKHGHLILQHLVRELHAPLQNWVEIDRLNKGGRPGDAVRTCLIYRLAEAAPSIIGKPASIAPTGSFADLCSIVLTRCGLSEKGIDKAIPAVVRRIRAEQLMRPELA